MTINEVYIEWEKYKTRLIKKSSMAAYKLHYYIHLKPFFGEMEISDIRKKTVQNYLYDRLDHGLKTHYVKEQIILLKMIVRWAAEEYELPVNAHWKLDWPSKNIEESEKVLRYSAQECRAIIEAAKAKPHPRKMGILLALGAGLRIGEACGVRFEDFDWAKKTVTIKRTVQRINMYNPDKGKFDSKISIGNTKTGSGRRELPLQPVIAEIIKNYSKVAAPEYYVCSLGDKPDDPHTFRIYYRSFILKEAGLKRCLKFHCLRHTFASTLIESGVDVKTAAALLGHNDISTTLNVYCHPSEEGKKNAVRKSLKNIF